MDRLFPVDHHQTMLSDSVRLSAFYNAIDTVVKENDKVVDVGAGTGILALYAARKTKEKVYAIEYFKETADLAQTFLLASGQANVEVVNKTSFNRPISDEPDAMISETLGSLGPEENIVEIFYEFCTRYPSIKKKIPSELSLYVQALYSPKVDSELQKMASTYLDAYSEGPNFGECLEKLTFAYCSSLRADDLSDSKEKGRAIELAKYELGKTERSDFNTRISCPRSANCLHFYFEAKLCEELKLSTHFKTPMTHWKHCFVARPMFAKELDISYSSSDRQLLLIWD